MYNERFENAKNDVRGLLSPKMLEALREIQLNVNQGFDAAAAKNAQRLSIYCPKERNHKFPLGG